MMHIGKKLALVLFALISGCTFVPSISEEQSYASSCDMITRELVLATEIIELHHGCGSGSDAAACYLIVAVGVPALSYVVSGSIVLAGNTLHWLEYYGRCDVDDALV